MATAWAQLVLYSSIPDNGVNTAWDHLLAQEGGGVGSPGAGTLIYYIGEEVIVDELLVNASIAVTVPITSIEAIGVDVSVAEEIGVYVDSIDIEGA